MIILGEIKILLECRQSGEQFEEAIDCDDVEIDAVGKHIAKKLEEAGWRDGVCPELVQAERDAETRANFLGKEVVA